MEADENNMVIYRSFSTDFSSGVHGFLSVGLIGACWGMVTPFPGTIEKGIFKPTPLFSSFSSVLNHGAYFAAIGGVYRLSSSLLCTVRRKDDFFNYLFGGFVVYKYSNFFSSNSKRLTIHNRCVGISFVSSFLFIGAKSYFIEG